MEGSQKCEAIAGRYCSGETPHGECMECMEFVNTCDSCLQAGSNESIGWNEGPEGTTLCDGCFSDLTATYPLTLSEAQARVDAARKMMEGL